MTADLDELGAALRAGDAHVFGTIARRLARQRQPAIREPLLQALQHHAPAFRAAAAQAAGALDTSDAVDPLFLLLQDPEPAVREAALAALVELAPELLERELLLPGPESEGRRRLRDLVGVLRGEGVPDLRDAEGLTWPGSSLRAIKLCIALLHHADSAVRVRTAQLLGATQDRRAVDELLLAMTHDDAETRVAAAVALGEHGKTSRIVGPLVEAFHDVEPRVRTAAALALSRFDVLSGSSPADRLRPVLEHLLRHPDIEARRRVVLMLGRSRGPESVDLLLQSAQDREASVRAETIVALSRFRDPRIEPALRVALTDPEEMVRLRAVDAMERLGTPEPLPLALKDPSPTVRVQAIKALKWTGVEPVLPELLASLSDPAEAVRLEVVELLAGHATPTILAALARALPSESFPLIRQKMLATVGKNPDLHDTFLREQGVEGSVLDLFRDHLTDPAPEVRAQAVQFLGDRNDGTLLPDLLSRHDDEAAEVRVALARALERRDEAEAEQALENLLADPSAEVREVAVWSLRYRPLNAALDAALPLLDDAAEIVRLSVAVLLGVYQLRGQLALESFTEIYRRTQLPGRLALLDVAEGIRDRRLVPLLLGAILQGEAGERARALQVLADLKRAEPARRQPRLTEELHRQAPLDSVGTRAAGRGPDPGTAPPLGEPLSFRVTTSPPEPGSPLRVEVWAARPEQQGRVETLACRPCGEGDHRVASKFGPTFVPRASLSAVLHLAALSPLDNEDDLHWDGEPASARFVLPGPVGQHSLRVDLHRDGLRIAHLEATLDAATGALGPTVTTRYQQAVAWAAEEDRPQAEARLTALRRVLPGLEIRWLAPGEAMPATAEVLYLFWSRAAARSPEVARWIEQRERVSVLPLESPETAPPPAELAGPDWIWAYLRGRQRST